MYAKLCNIEILPTYIKEVTAGDVLTVQGLVTNPLDWQYFYDKIESLRKGEKTNFTVVTVEGDRLEGRGNIVEFEKWSNHGQYSFKIKVEVKHQKSLTERRTRSPAKKSAIKEKTSVLAPQVVSMEAPTIDTKGVTAFEELLKNSLSMDMTT